MRKLNQTFGNVAYGAFSDSNNYATETNNFGETAFGILNKSTIDPDNFTSRDIVKSSKATLFSIGNGTEEERKNVIEIKGNGDVYINGVAGYEGTDTDEAGNIAEEFQGVHDSLDSIHMQKDDDSDLVYTLIVDGEERGTINIPKDQFLEDVSYDADTKELVFIFVTSDENNKEVRINIGNLVDVYSAGNGLSLTEGQFAIKLDPSTESYITVGADGLKVSGLDSKFDTLTLKDTELDGRILTAEGDIDALLSDLSALKGDGEGSIGNLILTAVDALKGGVSESYDTLKKIEDNIVSTEDALNEYKTSNDAEIAALKSKDIELSNKIDGIHVPSKVSELENDSKYQTEDQVNSRIQTVVGAAPEALDTLQEIGDALGNDPDFAATMTNKLTEINGKIGSNTYTGANYISKETNLTDAVIQLDEEIKATNDNLALEHANAEATYAKKTELDGYLPLSGGTLTGYLKMRELDGSELKHETFSLDLVQGHLDGKDAYMKFDVHPSDYSTNRTMIEIGNLIDSNTTANSSDVLGIYSDFFQARFNPISKSFAVCYRPNTEKDVMWSNITLVPRDDDEAYVTITSYLGDSKDPSNFNQATYKSTGITFRNKTASDLLHAAGGTTTLKTINGESLLGSGDINLPVAEESDITDLFN